MKKMKIAAAFLFVAVSVGCAKMPDIGIFDIKSGRVDYDVKGSGEIMGVQSRTSGTKSLIFDDYGRKMLIEENLSKETVMGDKSDVEKTHTLDLIRGAVEYHIDMAKKKTVRVPSSAMALIDSMGDSEKAKKEGKNMLEKMGGRMTGTDTVLGYKCEVWSAMGTKKCIYKGVALRTESNVMGIKRVETATKASFDIKLPQSVFAVPDFPIYDSLGKELKGKELSGGKPKGQKEAEQAGRALAHTLGKLAEAAEKSGIRVGEKPSAKQSEDMQKALLEALLPKVKEKILSKKKFLTAGRECLSAAATLRDADNCLGEMDRAAGRPVTAFKDWDEDIKKDVLRNIDRALENMDCIEKAGSTEEIKACMGRGSKGSR